MKEYFKRLGEEITGKRNVITGKKSEEIPLEHGKVQYYLGKGFFIISESKEHIILRKPKKFNGLLFIILLLLGFIPGVLYIIYYASKSDDTLTIKR
jgi:hypothetical protein